MQPQRRTNNVQDAIRALLKGGEYILFYDGRVCVRVGLGTEGSYWPNKREIDTIKRSVRLIEEPQSAAEYRTHRCWYSRSFRAEKR